MVMLVVVGALLGNQRGWVRYGGPQVRSGAVAKVVSGGEFSKGSVRRGLRVDGQDGVEQRLGLNGLYGLCGIGLGWAA